MIGFLRTSTSRESYVSKTLPGFGTFSGRNLSTAELVLLTLGIHNSVGLSYKSKKLNFSKRGYQVTPDKVYS